MKVKKPELLDQDELEQLVFSPKVMKNTIGGCRTARVGSSVKY